MEATIQTHTESDRILQFERVFNAPPERVFSAWTQRLGEWLGPRGMVCQEFRFDERVGGEYLCAMKSPEGNVHTVTGEVKVFERPNRLVVTWAWVNEGVRGHESTVDVRFTARGQGTVMNCEHRAMESADSAGHHKQGWTASFEKLTEQLAA